MSSARLGEFTLGRSVLGGAEPGEAVPYDFELFTLERAATVTAKLGSLILGTSHLDTTASAWLPVPAATFSYAHEYQPDDNGTLIFQSETATVALSYWQPPGEAVTPPLYSGDRIRATYDGKIVFAGIVDTTAVSATVDPAAVAHGATHRIDFTANALGSYAAALGKTVCWTYLPEELEIIKIRRFMTVDGWD